MYLPENAQFCISRLENAGFPCYAVGGCVRDALLGLTPHDYDLCSAAPPAKLSEIFSDFRQIHAGEKHGTVAVIFPDGEIYEITAFRTEGAYGDSRHPDWVEFVADIETDLARRDFTINAMAYSPTRGLVDPFGGRFDLARRTLRAVGEPQKRFSEDALRILRGVRFCATYSLSPDAETYRAMCALAPALDRIARERIFDELCKLIVSIDIPQMNAFAPILTAVIPELAPCIGFDQKNPHHNCDVYTHTAGVLCSLPPVVHLRLAALLHDIAKPCTFMQDENGIGHFYGHAEAGSVMADTVLRRLKAPNVLREQVVTLVRAHMQQTEPIKKCVRRQLSRLGADTFDDLLTLQQADFGSTASPPDAGRFSALRRLARELQAEDACLHIRDLALNGHDLIALGYEGQRIGLALQHLLDAVLDERVANEKAALLSYLQQP